MSKITILLIEDNEDILSINREAIAMRGYRVLEATALADGRALAERETPDLIVLDILLPDGNGLDYCRELREHSNVPLLFLTALGKKSELLKGIAAGGDDYLPKPYDLDILMAKIEAMLRREKRRSAASSRILARGPLTLDIAAYQAHLNGVDMQLTKKEFALLLLLVQNEGKTLAKEYLYESVWKQPLAGDGRAVWKQLSRLKAKLDVHNDTIVLTATRGEGYSLDVKL